MRFVTLILLVLMSSTWLSGQNKIEYTPNFEFKEGLYIGFEDFKNNNPIPITHVVSDFDIRDEDYLQNVLSADSVIYFDNMYEERRLAVVDLWGYCMQNRVFVGFGEKGSFNNPEFFDFYPLLSIGRVSFFTAYEQYYRMMNAGPNIGFGIGAGMGMGMRDPMWNNDMTVTETGQVQLMLDVDTGKILLVARGELGFADPKLVVHILQRDPVLLTEYNALSPKEQKQKSMFYLRKFNERNPIYFPE